MQRKKRREARTIALGFVGEQSRERCRDDGLEVQHGDAAVGGHHELVLLSEGLQLGGELVDRRQNGRRVDDGVGQSLRQVQVVDERTAIIRVGVRAVGSVECLHTRRHSMRYLAVCAAERGTQ
eukprot:6194310-Pleurochrysis_carterae.AAC.7